MSWGTFCFEGWEWKSDLALHQSFTAYKKEKPPRTRGVAAESSGPARSAAAAQPFRFQTQFGVLNFISTTTVFGTPVDVTLQELAMETFFPADAMTGEALRKMLPIA